MRSYMRRKPQPLEDFEALVRAVNMKLQEEGYKPLLEVEFIGARLYTGPMFRKYNTILRSVGSEDKGMVEKMKALVKANHYTTTIHVINSCIVKLGHLMKANKVYRGISGARLPERSRRARLPRAARRRRIRLLVDDARREGGARIRGEAGRGRHRLRDPDGDDRPRRRHLALAVPAREGDPVRAAHRARDDLVLAEEGQQLGQHGHLHRASPLDQPDEQDDRGGAGEDAVGPPPAPRRPALRPSDAPTRALVALDGLRSGQSMREPDWFNVPQNFRAANEVAFAELKAVFTVLGDIDLWDQELRSRKAVKEGSGSSPPETHNKMMKAARCAAPDEHESGPAAAQRASGRARRSAGRARARRPTRQARPNGQHPLAYALEERKAHRELAIKLIEGDKIIEKGLVQPWPGTLLLLMREDDRLRRCANYSKAKYHDSRGGGRRRSPRRQAARRRGGARAGRQDLNVWRGRRQRVNDRQEVTVTYPIVPKEKERRSTSPRRCASTTAAAAPCSARRRRTAMSRSRNCSPSRVQRPPPTSRRRRRCTSPHRTAGRSASPSCQGQVRAKPPWFLAQRPRQARADLIFAAGTSACSTSRAVASDKDVASYKRRAGHRRHPAYAQLPRGRQEARRGARGAAGGDGGVPRARRSRRRRHCTWRPRRARRRSSSSC